MKPAPATRFIACLALCLSILGCAATESGTSNDTADKSEKSNRQLSNAPYAVGVKTLYIHDKSRSYDALAGVDVGVRSLLTEVWYPVDKAVIENDGAGLYPAATFGDYVFGDRDVHRKMMTQTTFFHLTLETVREGVDQAQIDAAIEELFTRPRNAYREAPLATSDQAFPIVVMTHGDAGSRYNMETACEALAAQGYVVIAPEHTGNTPFAYTGKDPALAGDYPNQLVADRMNDVRAFLNNDGTYGPEDKYGQTYTPLASSDATGQAFIDLDITLVERVNDVRAALATLEQWNEEEGEFRNRLDLEKVGVMGRSFGGMTTLAALGLEDKFAAGVAVVPLVLPDFRKVLPSESLIDEERETVILNREGPMILSGVYKPTLFLSGAEDALIIGAGVRMANNFGGPVPSQDNPHAVLRESYETAEHDVYWGMLHDSNHSSFGVSGGYWWPELKPNTQKRTFDPEQEFTLIAPSTAHAIQAERVLAFFDTFLKDAPEARQRLQTNKFEAEGFEFEFREQQQ